MGHGRVGAAAFVLHAQVSRRFQRHCGSSALCAHRGEPWSKGWQGSWMRQCVHVCAIDEGLTKDGGCVCMHTACPRNGRRQGNDTQGMRDLCASDTQPSHLHYQYPSLPEARPTEATSPRTHSTVLFFHGRLGQGWVPRGATCYALHAALPVKPF